ncbi:MAG: PEP-CTERM sorting domain-containing protein [Bryobacteraceae bacterium]
MKIKRCIQAAGMVGAVVFMTAASVDAASIINYTTNAAGTEFVGGVNSLTLNSSAGLAATLTFAPNTTSGTGIPSNINLGIFKLVCMTCTTNQGTTFSAFTFDLIVDDTTDGATGEFVGTSTGGTVSDNSSTLQIAWATSPVNSLQLGPGTSNSLSGNFGATEFNLIAGSTLIVAPNSGSTEGDTTVQGQVSGVPEPATFALIGAGLLGLGFWRYGRFSPR